MFVLQDVLTQCFTEKIARFLVHASTVSTAIWRQVPVTNANTASLDKALLQVNVYSLGICLVFKKQLQRKNITYNYKTYLTLTMHMIVYNQNAS